MSNFDKKANQILAGLLQEGVVEGSETVKIHIPGSGNVDIKVRKINTSSGIQLVADETVESITKGDDVTEMVSSEDEENCSGYEDEEDSTSKVESHLKHEYLEKNKEKVDNYIQNYIDNYSESAREEGNDFDVEWLEQNARDYLLSLPYAQMKKEIDLSNFYDDSQEENEEDPELGKVLGGKDPSKQLAAVSVAGKLATKAQGGLFNDPQKKMNKAYGELMNKIATKISGIAAKI